VNIYLTNSQIPELRNCHLRYRFLVVQRAIALMRRQAPVMGAFPLILTFAIAFPCWWFACQWVALALPGDPLEGGMYGYAAGLAGAIAGACIGTAFRNWKLRPFIQQILKEDETPIGR
jgi:hypothetical protein